MYLHSKILLVHLLEKYLKATSPTIRTPPTKRGTETERGRDGRERGLACIDRRRCREEKERKGVCVCVCVCACKCWTDISRTCKSTRIVKLGKTITLDTRKKEGKAQHHYWRLSYIMIMIQQKANNRDLPILQERTATRRTQFCRGSE